MIENRFRLALWVAAEDAYAKEVVQPAMEDLWIGAGKEYSSKQEWIEMRCEDWLEEADARALLANVPGLLTNE